MPLIALAADKGSPGVTTTALALAAVWPRRALVAECDVAGGDLVYRLPAPDGSPLNPNRGLLSLAAQARRELDPRQLWNHTQVLHGGLDVIVGLSTAEQATGMHGLWSVFGQTFSVLPDADVFADCGRLGAQSPAVELLGHASVVLMVARASVDQVAHLRDRISVVSSSLDRGMGSGPPIGVLLVARPEERQRAAHQVNELLRASGLPGEVLATIAFDEKGASLLAGQWGGRLDRSALIKSAREAVVAIFQRLGHLAQTARQPG